MGAPKFRVGDRVLIDMMGFDSTFHVTDAMRLKPLRDTRDRGTGIVVRIAPPEEREPEEADHPTPHNPLPKGRAAPPKEDSMQRAARARELAASLGVRTTMTGGRAKALARDPSTTKGRER